MVEAIKKKGLDAKLVISYHDEVVLDCSDVETALKAGELFIDGLKWAGKFYGFRVPLDGSMEVGKDWGEVH